MFHCCILVSQGSNKRSFCLVVPAICTVCMLLSVLSRFIADKWLINRSIDKSIDQSIKTGITKRWELPTSTIRLAIQPQSWMWQKQTNRQTDRQTESLQQHRQQEKPDWNNTRSRSQTAALSFSTIGHSRSQSSVDCAFAAGDQNQMT